MADCLFISKDIQKELFAAGLPTDITYPAFVLNNVMGILVQDTVISKFVKETGVRIEKVTTDYEEIYQLLGYMMPTLKKEEHTDYIDGKGSASVVDKDYAKEKPGVQKFEPPTMASGSELKNSILKEKLRAAAVLLDDVAALID